MPLQNRVDPFGEIHAVPARGMFTGNRGVIHDPVSRTLLQRRWSSRAWLICALDHRGARRQVMGRNAAGGGAGWTELFFLDEVTALAAGHRPCFACRREQAKRFTSCLADALRTPAPRAPQVDGLLHRERLASGGGVVTIGRQRIGELPDGAVIAAGRAPYAVRAGRLLRWTFEGYHEAADVAAFPDAVAVLTPATALTALSAGYRPVWHATAAGPAGNTGGMSDAGRLSAAAAVRR